MRPSRENIIEDIKRGIPVVLNLNEFAEQDDDVCKCLVCVVLRRAIAEGNTGEVIFVLTPEQLNDPEVLEKL